MENTLFPINEFTLAEGISIEKFCDGHNVSKLNAFSSNKTLLIRLKARRRLGITFASLLLSKDGETPNEYTLSLSSGYAEDDEYEISVNTSILCAPETSGLFYYTFKIKCANEIFYLNSINNVDYYLSRNHQASFRMLIYSENFRTPDWAKRSIMYHVFVDRFNRGSVTVPKRDDSVINSDWENGIPQYAPYPGAHLENNEFFGGTLWGIAEKLDYLSELGVTTIYLSPIFKAYSNHKYDTGDYLTVDEMFGGEPAFKNLIDSARKKSINIVLDGVFNHTGDDSLYFNKYGKYSSKGAYQNKDSEYRDWYHFHPDNTYESWWGIKILPKLDHTNKTCREFFTGEGGVIEKYLKDGIGGWRLDVADELSDQFLDELRQSAKKANEQSLIIGEVWENAADKVAYSKRRRYFRGGQLDSVMNYPFKNALIEYVKTGNSDILYNELTEIYSSYPIQVSNVLMNLLGTHDTERILTVLADVSTRDKSIDDIARSRLSNEQRALAKQKLKIASTIQYTVYGFPSVFYGDEVGVEGYGDPFCRRPFPWHSIDVEILDHYKILGTIRRKNKAFDGGSFEITEHKKGLLCYKREKEDCVIFVCSNVSLNSKIISLPGIYTDLLTDTTYSEEISVPPMSALILKKL